jgi:hypothetical protein
VLLVFDPSQADDYLDEAAAGDGGALGDAGLPPDRLNDPVDFEQPEANSTGASP